MRLEASRRSRAVLKGEWQREEVRNSVEVGRDLLMLDQNEPDRHNWWAVA